jgi:hypothetical protein
VPGNTIPLSSPSSAIRTSPPGDTQVLSTPRATPGGLAAFWSSAVVLFGAESTRTGIPTGSCLSLIHALV